MELLGGCRAIKIAPHGCALSYGAHPRTGVDIPPVSSRKTSGKAANLSQMTRVKSSLATSTWPRQQSCLESKSSPSAWFKSRAILNQIWAASKPMPMVCVR